VGFLSHNVHRKIEKCAPPPFLNVLSFNKLGVLTQSKIVVLNKGGLECFRVSSAKWLRTGLFCDITHRVLLISNRRFGTTFRPHLQGRIGPIGYRETSVRNYHSSLRSIPEERGSQRSGDFLDVCNRNFVLKMEAAVSCEAMLLTHQNKLHYILMLSRIRCV